MNVREIAIKYRYAIFLLGVLFIVIAFAMMVHEAREITAASINPELQCNSLGYYNDFNIRVAKEWFCDYNESGWHFNKTRYDYLNSLVK